MLLYNQQFGVLTISMGFHHHGKVRTLQRIAHIIYVANDVFATSDIALYLWQPIKTVRIPIVVVSYLSIPMLLTMWSVHAPSSICLFVFCPFTSTDIEILWSFDPMDMMTSTIL